MATGNTNHDLNPRDSNLLAKSASLPPHRSQFVTPQFMSTDTRELVAEDIVEVRRLQSLAPSKHLIHVLERFPRYFDAVEIVDPGPQYFSRQFRTLGVLTKGSLIATIGLLRVKPEFDVLPLPQDRIDHFYSQFTDHDANVFDALNASLKNTVIGAPANSFSIHSLHVLPQFRHKGVATSLMRSILRACTPEQKENLFIETAREKPLRQFVESFGFKCIKRTCSFSQRLQYGTWGALLFKYVGKAVA